MSSGQYHCGLGCRPGVRFPLSHGQPSLRLVTVPSHSTRLRTRIRRFEEAVTAAGWMVFARLDHAAAAEKYKQKLLPRTVIVYGNPGLGTANMVAAPTLAI